ncbi:unnamed protein product [marine sediment metagenome]|uniref:Uncharacterized protein n=1 Tax=marine sediment metagenome TaxID=412755 RepID=X0ZXZ2_9ZZZZ
MATKDIAWKEVKKALRKPESPEARKQAAEAFRKYEKNTKGSTPILVSLHIEGFSHQIPLGQIPDEMERNPQFYELMQRIAAQDDKEEPEEKEEEEEW